MLADLRYHDPEDLVGDQMREVLDLLQARFNGIDDVIRQVFFEPTRTASSESVDIPQSQSQSQTQSPSQTPSDGDPAGLMPAEQDAPPDHDAVQSQIERMSPA